MSTTRTLKGAHQFTGNVEVVGTTTLGGATEADSNITLDNGTYSQAHLVLGTRHFWIGDDGELRQESGAPSSQADGFFVSPAVFTTTTTDATPTDVNPFEIPEGSLYYCEAIIVGRGVSDTNKRCAYHIQGCAYRLVGGSASLQSATSIVSIESDTNFACTFVASGNNLSVRVTGLAGTTVDWKVHIWRYYV
jgi:hypothetical protein